MVAFSNFINVLTAPFLSAKGVIIVGVVFGCGILFLAYQENFDFKKVLSYLRINKRIPVWMLIYSYLLALIGLDVINAASGAKGASVLAPRLIIVFTMFFNVFGGTIFALLVLGGIIDVMDTSTPENGIPLVSIHLTLAYISASSSLPWFLSFIVAHMAGMVWSKTNFAIVILYLIVSIVFIIWAAKWTNTLIRVENYRKYASYLESFFSKSTNRAIMPEDILITWLWPGTIDDRLSRFRICLAGLSFLAAVIPI